MNITGTTVMLTGGARIGRAVALWLAKGGASNFLLTYNRSQQIMEEAALNLLEAGAKVTVEAMDATKETEVRQTVERALSTYGKIDILINMASIYHARPIEKVTVEDWRADLDSNATSTLLCMAAVAPEM